MQQIQTMTNERPRRAAQVVPIEPSLRQRYLMLILGAIVLLLFVIITVISWNALGTSWGAAFSTLWNHSFLGGTSLGGIGGIMVFACFISQWKKLNDRRQQAARYTMTVGAWEKAAQQPLPSGPALPDTFAISGERNWSVTVFLSALGIVFVCGIGWLVYGYWNAAALAVQQGVPTFLIVLDTWINLAFALGVAIMFFLEIVYTPQQQLTATRDGLFSRRGYRTRFIPWQEARLFALIGQATAYQQESIFFYELASKDTLIRWPSINKRVNYAAWTGVPSDIMLFGRGICPSDLFPQQVQFLNIIVAERTGLQLYDLRGV